MTKALESLFEEASRRPAHEQDALARRWAADLQEELIGDDLPQSLKDELDLRLADMEKHPDNNIPAEEVFRRLHGRFAK